MIKDNIVNLIYTGINSSKVYCKYSIQFFPELFFFVLIVAKCIVNVKKYLNDATIENVLIVAKCIVNDTVVDKLTFMSIVLIVAKCIVNSTSKI